MVYMTMNLETQEDSSAPIFGATVALLKATKADENAKLWRFGGIATAEGVDEEGDQILRKTIDISYIKRRGYVNWDHSRAAADQLGYTTKAEFIEPSSISQYEDILDTSLSKSSTVYVEGVLYQHVKRAQEVYDILKSIPQGAEGALGLSVDGAMVRNKATGSVIKAVVRGLAMAPAPCQPDTLCRLVKSIGLGVATSVEYAGSEENQPGSKQVLTFNDAVVMVLEMFPGMKFEKAKAMTKSIFDKVLKGEVK